MVVGPLLFSLINAEFFSPCRRSHKHELVEVAERRSGRKCFLSAVSGFDLQVMLGEGFPWSGAGDTR